ncbi:uncharacterized protein E6C27_scaffold239G001240 [Cucumis melo var. makuwa]|uniref:Uncharacterized protein n=1 Tax=Cucumis melo var. makuwa TaxID=1194695 RepID=A0A5A7SWM7_CUCMM|nr:uncharacterized protein E6C27_scaffold239G001240 [Cucumis melo var. makuwa]
MDLCREIAWDCPNDGICQKPIPSLVEVCSEVHLEEDRTNSMSTPAIDSAAFNTTSSTHDNKKHDGKSVPICDHCKKQWYTKEQCWKLHGRPPGGKKEPPNNKQNSGRAYVSESAGPSQPLMNH